MVAASHERAGIFYAPVARAACPARSSTGQSHALRSSRLAFPVSLFLGYNLSRFGFIYECLRSQRAFDIDRRLMSHSYRPPRPHSKSLHGARSLLLLLYRCIMYLQYPLFNV